MLSALVYAACETALGSLAQAAAALCKESRWHATVVKIRAYRPSDSVSLASAVQTEPERLVTNCHVVYAAQRVEIIRDDRLLPATVKAVDVDHDLCTLEAPGIAGAGTIPGQQVAIGEAVIAVGFPGGKELTVTHGQVVTLHDYDGGSVIQVSAPFDQGASGGGLFDANGRLIGILTFKARAGGRFHFALPISCLNSVDVKAYRDPPQSHSAFWQLPYEKLPHFLRVLSVRATNVDARPKH